MKKNEKQLKKKKVSILRTLAPFLLEQKKGFVITIVASLLVGLCLGVQPLVVKYIVDDGIGASDPTDPWVVDIFHKMFSTGGVVDASFKIKMVLALSAIYLLISGARVGIWAIGYKQLLNSVEDCFFRISSRLFHHIQHLCMRFYDANSSGELYNCIMGSPMTQLKSYINTMILTVPYQAVSFVVSLVALLSFDIRLTIIMFACVVVMAGLNFFAQKHIRQRHREFLGAEKETSKYVSDMLHGTDAIKLYGIEEEAIHSFDESYYKLRRKSSQFSYAQFTENLKPELTRYIGTAVVYIVGGIYCIRGEISVGVLYAFLSSMTNILSTIQSWLNTMLQRAAAQTALERINSVLDQKTTTPELPSSQLHSVKTEKEKAIGEKDPCIEFRDVTFSYTNFPVFEHFNCAIKYGESVGFVGASGSGKSTITKLMMRLYEVDGGSILVHHEDIKDYQLHELRMSFGVVPQFPFIFSGTVFDNVRIVRPDASDEEVWNAMKIARVTEFVDQLSNKEKTVIGDGSLNLSGGQRQRIAIARAILKKPDIFIFDEATSALDNISERYIQEAMEELMKNHTVIIVAHRLTTVRNVDRILVFDKGKIVQEGNFNELAQQDGLFRHFLTATPIDESDENKHRPA